MTPMQPEQATFLLNFLIPQIKNEQTLTQRVIEAVPVDKGEYKPDPRSMSALDLAWHIASAECWFMNGIAAGAFSSGDSKPENIRSSADVSAWYRENFERALEQASKASPDQLLKPIDFFGVYNYPAIVYLQFMLNHSIHHRGQLSAYLRPMGAKVPSIYGGSADEPFEMTQKASS